MTPLAAAQIAAYRAAEWEITITPMGVMQVELTTLLGEVLI